MKPNEAPEKIYISPNSEESTYYVSNQYNRLIEYIRKDAFIEKACEFISLNVADYIDVTHKGGIEHLVLQEKFIEGFKKYVEE